MLSEVERQIVGSVQLNHAWDLVTELSKLRRESGSAEERLAVDQITDRLDRWGIAHAVHEAEALISLPRSAAFVVGERRYRAKTPSMAGSAGAAGVSAPLVYEPGVVAESVAEMFFMQIPRTESVQGKLVLTEGLPMPGRMADLEARGAAGLILISPSDRIHEGIATPVWGSPDLHTLHRRPAMPVVSIAQSDGKRVLEQMADDACRGTIHADHDEGWRKIPITVAEIPGRHEAEPFVLFHGHLDSWHVGVGDNATGDAALLEVARVLSTHRDRLDRTVRIAWWSGHSHGRYAGSTWYADQFANDIWQNCICHINCDSPGCRGATAYEEVYWMAELETFVRSTIQDCLGLTLPQPGKYPIRAGDISFNNLGLSTFFIFSGIPEEARLKQGLYTVGGCGGNLEWHTEADGLQVADRENLLRDMRMYAALVTRAATQVVHPMDFRMTVRQLTALLHTYAGRLDGLADLNDEVEAAHGAAGALGRLYAIANRLETVASARSVNAALRRVGRLLVSLIYSETGRYRQDSALNVPLLPEVAAVVAAKGQVPEPVLRTEARRALNRIQGALIEVRETADAV